MRRLVVVAPTVALVAGVVGLTALHARQVAPVPYPIVGSFQLSWSLVLAALLACTGYAVGIRDLPRSRAEVVLSSAAVVAVSFAALSASQLALGSQLLPRFVLLLVALLHPLWALLAWHASRDLQHRDTTRDRVLVVAERPEEVAALRADLMGRPERAASVVGHVRPGEIVDLPVGRLALVEAGAATMPTVLVLDAAAQACPAVVGQASVLHGRGVRFRTMSLFYEEWLGKLPLSELERVSLLFDIGELHRTRYVRTKRVVDVIAAAVGLVALVPLAGLLAALNLACNPGPLLFRQQRVGKGGEPFEILKFRTMAPGGGDHRSWTASGDARISGLGRLLRRTHLDELPQMVNILRGDLSLVGPRPEQVHYVDELRTKLPFYDARHLVRPGLTGWAQVKYGYAGNDADALEKLQYDLFYLRRQSAWFDLRIVARTFRHLAATGGR